MEKEQNKNTIISPKKKKLLGATALVAGASLVASAYLGANDHKTEASPQDSLKPDTQTTHVAEATPESTPSEEAYDADFTVDVVEGETIDDVAEEYYPDLNQETVVDEIEDANPGKDPNAFSTWKTVTVPGTIDGYMPLGKDDGSSA